ncbi:MAG: sensor domain-containing diguanylate cyclase [Pseudolabrys sp.]
MGRQAPQAATAIARPKRALSIRARLMILAVIAVVPLVAERIYNEQFDRAQRVEAAYQQALGLARQAAAAQNDVIVSTRAFLTVLAGTHVAASPTEPSCSGLLKSLVEPEPWIRVLSVADRTGRIICSSLPGGAGLDISKRSHFINAIKTGAFVVGDYFMGTRDKAPLIGTALPQRNADGSIESILVATLDLNWIGQIASALAVRSGSIMLLVDGQGTVLAHEPNPANWVGRRLGDHPLIRDILAQHEGVVTAASVDSIRRIFAFVALPGTGAHVAIGFDEHEVLARANSAMWLAFTELGIVTFLVLLSIWFGAERLLVRPIRVLAETAGRIGRGEDKTHASSLPMAAEFIPLAAALDEMADKLDTREQELRDINTQLRELAQLDSLTGLANRRTFNAHLIGEWKLAIKRRQPISALMIDVDHFKPFNDRYGHVQGDACLRKVGGALKSCTRSRSEIVSTARAEERRALANPAALGRDTQLAARYGGEEFAVLLPGVDLENATRIGERVRRAVEDLLIAHAGAPWGFVSISVGVATVMPGEGSNPQELTETADACLYEAKQRGRNTVIAHTNVPPLRASA